MNDLPLKHISISQINLYLRCSLKYQFQYVERLPKPFKPSGLAFGSAVHSSIEWLHKEKMQGKEKSLEDLLSTFQVDWFNQKIETEIHYKNKETEAELRETGEKMLSLYYQHAKSNGHVTASEWPFELPIVNQETGEVLDLPLQGYIDMIENGDVIAELKTSAKAMNQDTVDSMLQLTAYAYAYEQIFRQEPKELKIINLVKAKTPKLQILTTRRTSQDTERFFYTVQEVIEGIKARVFLPCPSFLCKDCEYAIDCLKWQGNKAGKERALTYVHA